MKVITFDEHEQTEESNANRLHLIENMSKATNQQSPVEEADRRANDKVQIEIQEAIFNEFGYYYERKKGEFGDGLHKNYINRDKIIERTYFLKICLAAQNKPNESMQGQLKLFALPKFSSILPDKDSYRKNMFAYFVYKRIPDMDTSNDYTYGKFAITAVVANKYSSHLKKEEFNDIIDIGLKEAFVKWNDFQSYAIKQPNNAKYFPEKFDTETGNKIIQTNWSAYFKSLNLVNDLSAFFY